MAAPTATDRPLSEEKRLPWVSPGNWSGEFGGLTKRELFAAMAMQGFRMSGQYGLAVDVARHAVADADALLKELAL